MPDAPRPKRPADTDCPEASTCSILRDSVGFEALIADLSSRFVNLAPDEVDREIEDALRRVCEPLGIDLAVLWQWSDADPSVIVPTHAYVRRRRPATCRAAAPGAVPVGRRAR